MAKIKVPFVFFDNESAAKISDNDLFVNGNEDLVVTMEGSGEIVIEGLADMNAEEWHTLALINKSDFTVHEVLTTSGIYSCSVNGFYKIRANAIAISEPLSLYVNLV